MLKINQRSFKYGVLVKGSRGLWDTYLSGWRLGNAGGCYREGELSERLLERWGHTNYVILNGGSHNTGLTV